MSDSWQRRALPWVPVVLLSCGVAPTSEILRSDTPSDAGRDEGRMEPGRDAGRADSEDDGGDDALKTVPFIAYGGADAVSLWVAPRDLGRALQVRFWPAASPQRVRDSDVPAAVQGTLSRVVRLEGLSAATAYAYEVVAPPSKVVLARGSFHTGPAPGAPTRGTLAVVSCMNPDLYPHQAAWAALLRQAPELLLQIGDNTYGVKAQRIERSRAKFLLQRQVPEYARVLSEVGVLAIWDDHDFAGNGSDRTTGPREASLALFRELFPNPGAGLPGTPGVFFSTRFGDVDLFFLDVRYYRSPASDLDDASKEMLGEDQFGWLEGHLRASDAKLKLIASGSTLNLSDDGWRTYTRDRARLVALTREVPGIVFLTGDLHRTEFHAWPAMAFGAAGYPIMEIISSGIAVRARAHSLAILRVDTTLTDPKLEVEIVEVSITTGEVQRRQVVTIRGSELVPSPI